MRGAHRTLLAILIAVVAILVTSEIRYRGAPVRPASGDPLEFSAERARAAFGAIATAPHATGTGELAAVRARWMTHLRSLGWSPEERATLACGRYGTCARVHRVLTRIAGSESTGAVLLIAHLDAVGASPGASDDGAGVATLLEIARALRQSGPLRNDVLLMTVEGEELGLIGAEAFVREDPAAREVRVVINLEARGTGGAASLFQISRGGGFLVDVAARAARRPVGSSLHASIYERMPNDTDLTVFLEHGFAGMNYAFTEGVESYHTSHDDLAHQDPRSVQHMGDSALAAVRALARVDLRAPPRYELVWFDVLGLGILRFPVELAFPLALATLVVLLAGAAIAIRAGRAGVSELGRGASAWSLAVVIALLSGVVIVLVARAAGAVPTPWIARPSAILFALIAAAIVALSTPVLLFGRGLRAEGFAFAIWIVWAILSALLARAVPGVSYLFLVPAAVAAMTMLAAARVATGWIREVAIALPALCGLSLWAPILRALYPTLGLVVAPAITLAVAIALLPIAPLLLQLPRVIVRRATAGLAAFVAVAAAIAAFLRPFSPEVPRRVNVVVAREEGQPARIGVDATWGGTPWGDPPAEMRAALGDAVRVGPIVPFRDEVMPFAEAPSIELTSPEATVVASQGELVRLRLRSARGAPTLMLIAPPGAGLLDVDVDGAVGAATFARHTIGKGVRAIRFDGIGTDGIEVSCRFAGAPGELLIADVSYGVPVAAASVVAARPADAAPSQDGDLTIAYRRVRP